MTPLMLLFCVETACQRDKADRESMIRDARTVIAALVASARDRKPSETGDELTGRYLRDAAAAAERLPGKRAGAGFALAVGVALDTSSMMRGNPAVASIWKQVESDAERAARLKVLGKPTMHDRHDLAQHFSVSMALTAVLGAKSAESAGLLKELLDANEGGSGFSFVDYSANLAGIELAQRIIEKPATLTKLRKRFEVEAYVPAPQGIAEGLTLAEFEKRYGGIRDPRFRAAREDLLSRIHRLRGFKED